MKMRRSNKENALAYYYRNRERILQKKKEEYLSDPLKFKLRIEQWRKDHPDRKKTEGWKLNRRRATYKRKFGVSLQEYERLFSLQEGKCAICDCIQVNKRLAIDHCHQRGIVRGLLCSSCNLAIGLLRDEIKLLQSAIAYLEKNPK